MPEEIDYIDLPGGTIAFHRFGWGPHTLVALHGYAQTAHLYSPLAATCGEQFTILAPDLPGHGHTEWDPEVAFEPKHLQEAIKEMLAPESSVFAVVGMSMGARMAMHLDARHRFLLAPEGLKNPGFIENFFRSPTGFRLFRGWLKRPARVLRLGRFFRSVNLINEGTWRFLQNEFGHDRNLWRAWHTWQALYYFRLNKKTLEAAWPKAKHVVIAGRFDRISKPEDIRKSLGALPHEMEIVEGSHQLPWDDVFRLIGQKLAESTAAPTD